MEALTHRCPNCGGALTFEPSDQQFHCPYCLSVFTEEEVTTFEQKQKQAKAFAQDEANTQAQTQTTTQPNEITEDAYDLYSCPSCGAQIACEATTAATECYFCHSPVILSGRLSGDLLPDKILPFKITKKEAQKQFIDWASHKHFVPRAFFNEQQVEKMTGVYFPYWITEAKGEAEISGKSTTIRVWQVGNVEYTETKQYHVHRKGKFHFKNLVKNALTKNVQKKMVEAVQPFPLESMQDFHSQYLSGFLAEKRDIEFDQLKANVRHEMGNYALEAFEDTIAAQTSFQPEIQESKVLAIDKQYVLLPMWLVTYKNRASSNKVYYYAMNGITGKTAGILPLDSLKLGLVSGISGVLVTALLLLGGYFFL